MAKGNPLMSQMRGKVGDLVFTRLAGEQITRSRNRNPKNPQTIKQMAQRAALATCVEFFTRGRKNLFKFAFENKRPGESDYNAFVRANIGIMPVQSHKSLAANASVFGPVILSQGSLTAPNFRFDETYAVGAIECKPIPDAGETLTIGQLSQLILDRCSLQNGDILTFVGIDGHNDVVYETLSDAIDNGSLQENFTPQNWAIKQFTLDVYSNEMATTLGIFDLESADAGAGWIELDGSILPYGDAVDQASAAVAVIASRNTPSGVKVSTSTMLLSAGAKKGTEIGTSDEWKEFVASTWQTSNELDVKPENILEGSISVN